MDKLYFHNYYLSNKEAHLKKAKEYYLENREKILKRRRELKVHLLPINKQNSKNWRKRNPEKVKLASFKNDLKMNYGMTLEDYCSLVEKQENKCKICGNSQIKNKRLSVDHCHKTGKIRGLLCHSCNVAIGLVKENTNTLQSMVAYLQENNLVK